MSLCISTHPLIPVGSPLPSGRPAGCPAIPLPSHLHPLCSTQRCPTAPAVARAALHAAAPVPHTGAAAAAGGISWVMALLIAVGVVLFFLALVVFPVVFPEGAAEPEEATYPQLLTKLRPRCICGQLATHRVTLLPPIAANPKPFYGCLRAARTFERHYGARLEAL